MMENNQNGKCCCSGTESNASQIVIVGSLNADLIVRTARFPKPGETLVGQDLLILPGGKGANQAVAAAKLGGRVKMVGAVGNDGNGKLLLDSVSGAGVDISSVAIRDDCPSGTAVITVDDAGENTIIISGGANATLTQQDFPEDLFKNASALGLCLEVAIDTVLAAARVAHQAGVKVLTNLSPYQQVPAELLELTDVLLVNEHEAAQLGSHQVAEVIVTKGGDGVTVFSQGNKVADVAAVSVSVVDTTGCGDAFMGAVLAKLAEGKTVVEAAEFAVGVGAYAATKMGAQSSYPTLDQLTDFLAG